MDLRPQVQNFSVGRHRLEPQDVRAQRPILDHILSTSIGRNVPANEAGALRAQIQRRLEAVGLKMLIQLVENNPGLAVDDRGDLAEALYLVHALHIDDNLVENRHAAPNQTRIPALRNHRQSATIAVGQYF